MIGNKTHAQINQIRDGLRTSKEEPKAPFILSQIILFQSRKKWGIVYALATVVGLSCFTNISFVPSGLEMKNVLSVASNGILLPSASFSIIIGMYVFNDLVDADLDRSNGKKRPISTGLVSKRDAWIFITLTNATGILLASITFNLVSMTIAGMVMSIGLMYSVPKIALKDKFLLKTLSIALAMMLCTILGSTAYLDTKYVYHNTNVDSLITPAHAVLMLGMMIFVTSPVSDAADITGDSLAGRRTIPIVIGRENTIKMAILLAISMSAVSWLFYSLHGIGVITTVLVNLLTMTTMLYMLRSLKKLHDTKFVLDPRKITMPLYIMLQSALIMGTLLFWI
jgi:geranylgeranylglycerol-phosphate geranylgeranyltransferase